MTERAGQMLVWLLAAAAVAFAFALFGFYPGLRRGRELVREKAAIEQRIEEQKILLPLHRGVTAAQQSGRQGELSFPPSEELPQDEINGLPVRFSRLAQQCGLELVSAAPGLADLGGGGPFNITVSLTGKFHDLRRFLIAVGRLPYLRHVERIEVNSEGAVTKFEVTLWLAAGPGEGEEAGRKDVDA